MLSSIEKVWEVSITKSVSISRETLTENSLPQPGIHILGKRNVTSDYQYLLGLFKGN